MDNHLLFELTYVFYRVCSAIIHGECWLVKSSRKFCLFYPPRNGWLRNLAQRLFHNVNSYSFTRRTPVFPLMKMLFFTGEGFAWWSSRPLLVYSIFFINRGDIRAGRGSFLLCLTSCFFKSSIFRCMTLSLSLLWDMWLFLRKPLPSVWMVYTLPSW